MCKRHTVLYKIGVYMFKYPNVQLIKSFETDNHYQLIMHNLHKKVLTADACSSE